jgi:hypothetical protein
VWTASPCPRIEARSAQLAKYEGMAIKADELLALGKAKGREQVRRQAGDLRLPRPAST